MTPWVFALNKDALVVEAIEMVKLEKENIYSTIYVVNEKDKLVGNIDLSELFFANHTKQLAAIMNTDIPKVLAELPIRAMHNHAVWSKYLAIPVVDRSGKLIGNLEAANSQKSNIEAREELNQDVLETGSALGELYSIGIRGLLQSLSR
jgi:Mg/Co/Ni transporter MgtE